MLKLNEFYCVSCRKVVKAKAADICLIYYNNKRTGKIPALKGTCKCGTNLTKFVKRDAAAKLEEKFGKCSKRKSPKKSAKKSPKKSVKKSVKKSAKKSRKCPEGKVRSRETGRCRSKSRK